MNRRTFLRRSAVLGAAGLAGAHAEATAEQSGAPAQIAFDGAHQAGILAPQGAQATLAALDAIAPNRSELVIGLRQLSAQARRLATGYRFGVRDPSDPPPDSGMLGPTITADALTVTLAFGASLFDDRYGLAARRPDGLTRMPRFPDDDIDDERAHGDVLLTLNAQNRDTLVHALRELLRPVRGAFVVRWTLDGFLGADRGPTPRNARRNLFGFRDGT
jgi:deferrochelatase/peroxidase EfeB